MKRKHVCKEKCAICLEEKEEAHLVKLNACRHMYCEGCITEWCKRENTCPQCKKRITFLTVPGRERRKRIRRADLGSDDDNEDPQLRIISDTLTQYVASRTFRRSLAENLLFHPTAGIRMVWHIIQRTLPMLSRQIHEEIESDGVENISSMSIDILDATDAMLRLRRTNYAL
jgi:hypothetical protein